MKFYITDSPECRAVNLDNVLEITWAPGESINAFLANHSGLMRKYTLGKAKNEQEFRDFINKLNRRFNDRKS